jgi:hypothetical protein
MKNNKYNAVLEILDEPDVLDILNEDDDEDRSDGFKHNMSAKEWGEDIFNQNKNSSKSDLQNNDDEADAYLRKYIPGYKTDKEKEEAKEQETQRKRAIINRNSDFLEEKRGFFEDLARDIADPKKSVLKETIMDAIVGGAGLVDLLTLNKTDLAKKTSDMFDKTDPSRIPTNPNQYKRSKLAEEIGSGIASAGIGRGAKLGSSLIKKATSPNLVTKALDKTGNFLDISKAEIPGIAAGTLASQYVMENPDPDKGSISNLGSALGASVGATYGTNKLSPKLALGAHKIKDYIKGTSPIIKPTEHIADIYKKYDIPYTVADTVKNKYVKGVENFIESTLLGQNVQKTNQEQLSKTKGLVFGDSKLDKSLVGKDIKETATNRRENIKSSVKAIEEDIAALLPKHKTDVGEAKKIYETLYKKYSKTPTERKLFEAAIPENIRSILSYGKKSDMPLDDVYQILTDKGVTSEKILQLPLFEKFKPNTRSSGEVSAALYDLNNSISSNKSELHTIENQIRKDVSASLALDLAESFPSKDVDLKNTKQTMDKLYSKYANSASEQKILNQALPKNIQEIFTVPGQKSNLSNENLYKILNGLGVSPEQITKLPIFKKFKPNQSTLGEVSTAINELNKKVDYTQIGNIEEGIRKQVAGALIQDKNKSWANIKHPSVDTLLENYKTLAKEKKSFNQIIKETSSPEILSSTLVNDLKKGDFSKADLYLKGANEAQKKEFVHFFNQRLGKVRGGTQDFSLPNWKNQYKELSETTKNKLYTKQEREMFDDITKLVENNQMKLAEVNSSKTGLYNKINKSLLTLGATVGGVLALNGDAWEAASTSMLAMMLNAVGDKILTNKSIANALVNFSKSSSKKEALQNFYNIQRSKSMAPYLNQLNVHQERRDNENP